MHNFLYSFIITSIAGLSTLIGGLLIFIKIKENSVNKFIVFCLSFSIAIMIGISITDLIPNSYFTLNKYYSILHITCILFISFIISYTLIRIIDNYINYYQKNDLYKMGILNMLILILHNLPEGIATFISSYNDITIGVKLSIVIMLHNIPEGISIAVPMYYATKSKYKAIKATLISGLSEPLGAILAYILFRNIITDQLISIVLIVVGCLMITLSIEKLYPKAKNYKENNSIIIGLILGIIFIIINIIIH